MKTRGRYSKYIRPLSIASDMVVVLLFSFVFFKEYNYFFFVIYELIGWFIIGYSINFYGVYRFTKPIQIISLLLRQFFLYAMIVFTFFTVNKFVVQRHTFLEFFVPIFVLITTSKFLLYYLLKQYRTIFGGNIRQVVIVGYSKNARNLKNLFVTQKAYGYQFQGFFSDKINNSDIVGSTQDIENYVLKNKTDDIYCTIKELSNVRLKKLIFFANQHNITIKFIPESEQEYLKNLKIDYYDFFPVLSFQQTLLEDNFFLFLKRLFDIVFSLLIIIFVLSWLGLIIAILIKLESKGPVIFKQKRNGLNFHEFECYKFRSMYTDANLDPAQKNDGRVTKIGQFLRKTSLDELPQYFNVLIGNMSVVGPRPHAPSFNEMYLRIARIEGFMHRHAIKPGITGLAQIKGYRGEVKESRDIVNRVRLDLFYIQNWSFLLDLKIVFDTIIILLKGQDEAY